jgi:arginine deiminase
MFEHPHYLSEKCLDSILNKNGWKVLDKIYYRNHSIFYITQPSEFVEVNTKFEGADDVMELVNYMKKRAEDVKDKTFYVFGAHFPYYYLLNMGIKEEQIIAVADNDPFKQNKRMYGTNTKTISPLEIPDGANVFLEMGPYTEEIKKGLNNIKKVNYV